MKICKKKSTRGFKSVINLKKLNKNTWKKRRKINAIFLVMNELAKKNKVKRFPLSGY